jgi:hypothetical protein
VVQRQQRRQVHQRGAASVVARRPRPRRREHRRLWDWAAARAQWRQPRRHQRPRCGQSRPWRRRRRRRCRRRRSHDGS